MRIAGFLAALVFLSLAFISDARAQIDARGQVAGKVKSETGTPIKRAYVSALDLTTLETTFAVTNDFGSFVINDLQIGGVYLIRVTGSRYYFGSPFQSIVLDSFSKNVLFVGSEFPISLPKAP